MKCSSLRVFRHKSDSLIVRPNVAKTASALVVTMVTCGYRGYRKREKQLVHISSFLQVSCNCILSSIRM